MRFDRWLAVGIVLTAVLAIAAVACGDDDGDGGGATATMSADETPQATVSVEITSPADGATVSSPVTLEVRATGVEIASAGDLMEGAAHFHAFVDVDPVAEGEGVPQETDGIFHFATNTLDLELEPGEHTVTVVLGDNTHLRLRGVDPAVVTFTVAEDGGAPSGVTLTVTDNADLGPILTDPDGNTLYVFANDAPGVSNCADTCAELWPPLLSSGDITGGEGVTGEIATIERADGGTQVTYDGAPLYYFANDEAPGDTNGDGFADVWSVVGVGE